MVITLSDRQKSYEDAVDLKLIRRLPIIIRVDGRSFHRVTKRIPKPYSVQMAALMANTMLSTAKEIEGCVFAYQQSDEITFVLRNDQTTETEPWFNNRIQKIASVSAALATFHFNDMVRDMDKRPDFEGIAVFDARVFAVPSIMEVVNNLIFRQQDCIRNAVTAAAHAELSKKFDERTAVKLLQGQDILTRISLLLDKCNIDFHDYYPSGFRFGISAYRIPKIVQTESGQVTRQRWSIDDNLPEFAKRKEFLLTILNSGRDIFRVERDLDKTEQE